VAGSGETSGPVSLWLPAAILALMLFGARFLLNPRSTGRRRKGM